MKRDMKKLFMLTMLAAFAISATTAMASESVSVTPQTYEPLTPDETHYSVKIDGLVEGGFYGMIVFTGDDLSEVPEISEDNIIYIDQKTAKEYKIAGDETEEKDDDVYTTSIVIDNFALLGAAPTDKDFQGGTIFIGGPGLDTATVAGYLTAPQSEEQDTVTLTCNVTDDTNLNNVIVKLFKNGEQVGSDFEQDLYTGEFTIDVAPDTYDVMFAKNKSCAHTITGVPATETLTLPTVSLKPGDVDETKAVDSFDLNTVLQYMGTNNASADATGEIPTEVNAFDLNAVLQYIGATETTEAYSAE